MYMAPSGPNVTSDGCSSPPAVRLEASTENLLVIKSETWPVVVSNRTIFTPCGVGTVPVAGVKSPKREINASVGLPQSFDGAKANPLLAACGLNFAIG